MKLVLVDSMDQVLEAALRRKPKAARRGAGRGGRAGDEPADRARAPSDRVRPAAVPAGRPAAGRRPSAPTRRRDR